MNRGVRPAANGFSQFIPEIGTTWLDLASLRGLSRRITILRWLGGLVIVAVVGYVIPPRTPAWLVLLISWLATYNGLMMFALTRVSDSALVRLVRVVAVLDLISFFGWIVIYLPSPPLAIWAVYSAILIVNIGLDGLAGTLYSIAAFLVGFGAIQLARATFYGGQSRFSDLLIWGPIFICLAIGSLTVDVTLLQANRPAKGPAILGVLEGTLPAIRLSAREQEVLRLVADGYSNTMIASRLHLSENTVKGHVESLLNRLNARNRAEAVAAASRMKLL